MDDLRVLVMSGSKHQAGVERVVQSVLKTASALRSHQVIHSHRGTS